ncbi:hypothetical protein QBC34DRAFT_488968 [Podospora aff. communis PSN243]|uniref:Short-chain dehydrogenase/reductase 3 n=1 Tax=Podospora aff. communis PSN243 TaxID=3040156 RepID=A0AAV9G4Z5_9PEZI|nr:hypothetical protein QBC34DRAFT_488968 [Podospora aff. communis PSN243]
MASVLSSAAGALAKLAHIALSPLFSGPLLLTTCFPDTARDAVAWVTERLPVDMAASSQTATLVLCALFARATVAWSNRSLNTMASNAWRVGPSKDWHWPTEIAVVTGGSSGIGKAIAERLTALGIRVAIFDVQDLPMDLQDNSRVRFYQCDVTSSESIAVAADAVRRELGHPSILINNAGIAQPGPILKTDETFLRRILGVNLMSMWFTTQQFLPSMIESNKGHVVTMASLASFIALATAADYSATKAGALSFHESLTAEVKHIYKAPGILTTVVHPNFVRTPLTADFSDRLEKSGVQLLSSEEIADTVVGHIESRRGGQLIIPKSATLVSGIRGWPTWMQELLRDAIARGSPLFAYIYTICITPFVVTRFAVDIALYLFPSARPSREWSFSQAVRIRALKLFLFYCSLVRAGTKLTLRSGQEGSRFEVIRPSSPESYAGPLFDHEVSPEPLGVTWTPERPPLDPLASTEPIVTLHMHGGAFVIGDGRDGDTGYLARTLIRHFGCTHVCSPQYRLSASAGGRFPAAVQDALTTHLHLIREKAGGNIALGLLRYIHEYGRELDITAPRAVALWSPWVDISAALRQDPGHWPNYATDYLNKEFGQWGAAAVSGYGLVDPEAPYLSLLHHLFKMEAEIPMFVQAGEKELIYEDIKAMALVYREIGWNVKLLVSLNCPHDISMLGPVAGFDKEAKGAAREARRFLVEATDLRLGPE